VKNFLFKIFNSPFARYFLLAFSLLLIFISFKLYSSGYATESNDEISNRVQHYLTENDRLCNEQLNQTEAYILDHDVHELFHVPASYQGIGVFVYKGDSLAYWNNSRLGLNRHLQNSYLRNKVIKLGNFWLRLLCRPMAGSPYTIISGYVIKREYPFDNEYVQNGFDPALKLHEKTSITFNEEDQSGIPVYDHTREGKFLFTLVLPENEKAVSDTAMLTMAMMMAAGILLLILFIKLECDNLEKLIGVFPAAHLFVLTLFGLRYLTLYMGFPAVFTQFPLFQPELYAASFLFPSLGDFMINILLLFIVCYHVYNKSNQFNFDSIAAKTVRYSAALPLFLIVAVYPVFINTMISGLIRDSGINFNVNNIFDLSVYSILGITMIGILFFSFLLMAVTLVIAAVKMQMKWFWPAAAFTVSFILLLIFNPYNEKTDLLITGWPYLMLMLVVGVHYRGGKIFSFNSVVVLLIIFSWYTAHSVTKYSEEKEWENRKLIMAGFATDEDPNTELRYADMEADLLQSDLILQPFQSNSKFNKLEFDRAIEEDFFKGSWSDYDIQYYLFNKDSTPLGIEGFAPIRDFKELDEVIRTNGLSSAFNPNIYFIYNSVHKLSYVIKLPVTIRTEQPVGFLFCELRSKKIPEDIGFPELLLDKPAKSGGRINVIRNYSFARYIDGMQVARFGQYNYSLTDKTYLTHDTGAEYFSFSEGNFKHMCIRPNERTLVIMGMPEENFISKATTFSYLFTLLCLLLLTGMLIRQISSGNTNFQLTLQGKIQFLLVCVLLFSLVLFGIGTRYFVSGQYEEKNKRIISEKLQSVRIEVSHKVGNEKALGYDLQNYLSYILSKFSNVFITDINLYNVKGELIASSRPKIFTSGLLSSQMDPQAYHLLSELARSEVIQEEKIGSMNYLSGYIPLLNNDGKLLGFVNLPYFSKQSVLRSEYSSFLVAIINIFILLFAISLLAALFVSNWITKPLRVLQQNLAAMQLGKSNKKIEYKGNDEIASLVNEYNIKVTELEKYASELARSERESAWREMAKQVAHEIKNPLTPMRLTVQHAQRSLKKEDPDYETKMEKFTNTLIEQIDTLSHIANEFSNFAKMPKAVNEELDLVQILESTVELYKETPGIRVRFNKGELNQVIISGDKEQLLRVAGNLIKNAIQSIPDHQEGKVDVYIKSKDNNFIFEVRDNGTGIDPEKIDKIFTPNFTTKSTGMGLGLAMVKNIVESSGGRIWFETSQGHGTSFFVMMKGVEIIV
jgi:two-component system nitrogen regulation sensor histidine kinase NtrY